MKYSLYGFGPEIVCKSDNSLRNREENSNKVLKLNFYEMKQITFGDIT